MKERRHSGRADTSPHLLPHLLQRAQFINVMDHITPDDKVIAIVCPGRFGCAQKQSFGRCAWGTHATHKLQMYMHTGLRSHAYRSVFSSILPQLPYFHIYGMQVRRGYTMPRLLSFHALEQSSYEKHLRSAQKSLKDSASVPCLQ